jgi:hypothetical protein
MYEGPAFNRNPKIVALLKILLRRLTQKTHYYGGFDN